MKRAITVGLIGIALVIIGYVLFGRVRYAKEYIQDPAQVVWNKDKIFILISKGLSIREGHRIELWLEPIFRFVPRAEVVKKDLVVLEIDGGSLKTWHLENFGFGGSASTTGLSITPVVRQRVQANGCFGDGQDLDLNDLMQRKRKASGDGIPCWQINSKQKAGLKAFFRKLKRKNGS